MSWSGRKHTGLGIRWSRNKPGFAIHWVGVFDNKDIEKYKPVNISSKQKKFDIRILIFAKISFNSKNIIENKKGYTLW